MKKVYKYGTGQTVPEGAIYLSTQVETYTENERRSEPETIIQTNRFVWHYFLVEIDDE